MSEPRDIRPLKGRGAVSNPEGRFESLRVTSEDDGWYQEALPESIATVITPERAKSIITTNDSPDVGFEYSINPYRGCEHGCPYCMGGETPVLLADGTCKPLAELRIGDEIYGTRKVGHYRRYVRTTVRARWRTTKPAYRVTLEDGTTLIASADHRFLTERGWKYVARSPAGWARLTPNDSLLGFGALLARSHAQDSGDYRKGYLCGLAIRTSVKADVEAIRRLIAWPDRQEGDWGRGFLAGIFDAEGSYSCGAARIANTDQQIIGATSATLASLGFTSIVETHSRSSPTRPVHYVRILGGLREHLRFVQACRPSIERKCSIAQQAVKSKANLRVVSVEPLPGERELFDITTGTGDFIANGVISHNCYARPAHSYIGLSPGLDFETKLFYKADAANVLERDLSRPGYVCKPIMIGANTDPYQPVERKLEVTRSVLEVLAKCRHPVKIGRAHV